MPAIQTPRRQKWEDFCKFNASPGLHKKSQAQPGISSRSFLLRRYILIRLAPPQMVTMRQGVTRTLS